MIPSFIFTRSPYVLTRSSSSFAPNQLRKHYVSSSRPSSHLVPNTSTTTELPPLLSHSPSDLLNVTPTLSHITVSLPPSDSSNKADISLTHDNTSRETGLSSSGAFLNIGHRPSSYNTSILPLSHYFDTFALVERLEMEGGFTRNQARFLMEIMQEQVRSRVTASQAGLLKTSQLENESHVLSAGIDDLRNEVTMHRRNDAALLRSDLASIARDIESLEQYLNEDVSYLQNSIDLTLNDFRSDIRQEQKVIMIETQQVNHRLTVLHADATMALEQMKWETIWQSLLSIVLTGMTLTAVGYGLSSFRSKMAPPTIERTEFDETLTVADMEI